MRVRSNRQSDTRHRGGLSRRKPLVRREPPATPAVEAEPATPAVESKPAASDEDELFDERRLRASGGPNDRAQYTCGCGYVWETDVSASVACPHCGASQAW
jgi:rubrerythrin